MYYHHVASLSFYLFLSSNYSLRTNRMNAMLNARHEMNYTLLCISAMLFSFFYKLLFSSLIIILIKIFTFNIVQTCLFHILLYICIDRHLHKMYECCTHSLVRTYTTVRAPSTGARASCSRSRG